MLTNGNIIHALLMLSVPIIITNFLQNMYNLTDTYWLGKIGTVPQAAISMVSPIQSTVMGFGQGITMAGSILLAQYIGANRVRSAKLMANQLFLCAMIFSVFSAAALSAVTPLLTSWMGANGEIYTLGNIYLRIVVLDTPFLFIINIFGAVSQSQGNTVFPMLLNLLGIILNMILDPLFMITFNMGIGGAALATLLAKVPCAAIALAVLTNKNKSIYLRLKFMRPNIKKIKRIVTLGLPTAIGNSAMQFGFVLMSKSVYAFGSSAMAAYGVGNKINGLITLPANALGSATATIVGQNIGAGNTKRAVTGYKCAVIIGMGLLFTLGIILSRTPVAAFIAHIFTSDAEVLPMAVDFISIMAFWCFTNSIYNCTVGLLNGTGKTKITMMVEAARLWVFRFMTIFFCQNILHMAVESIWYSVVVSNGLSALVLLILYLTRVWEKNSLLVVNSGSASKHIAKGGRQTYS